VTGTAIVIDGNGIGGILEQIFAAEPTAALRICQSCHTEHPTGEHRAYRGAGITLRCPHCGDVALRISQPPGRTIVELRGTWTFETA
jgi:Zn finger protein HypA/HybF involved in hydrogenase expression